ncbi:hypothetical protein [Streptomyces adustus]
MTASRLDGWGIDRVSGEQGVGDERPLGAQIAVGPEEVVQYRIDAAEMREAVAAGVEAAVWCETVTSGEDLEFLLLPRLAGVADRAGSPAGAGNWDAYRERPAVQSAAWHRRGWTWFASALVD